MRLTFRYGALAVILLSAGLVTGTLPSAVVGQKITTEVIDGIPVVRNPKRPVPPPGSPSQLVLKHELSLGRESGDENYMFSQLRSIQVDDEENIYALDIKDVRIKAYDKNGRHLLTFGKKGQGPGEMDLPLRMEMSPERDVVISDFGNAKLIFFSPRGVCGKEIPLGKYQFMSRFKFNSRGEIYGHVRTYDVTKSISELIKFSPDFKPLATMASFEERRAPRVITAFSPTFSFQVSRKDDLLWTIADADKYELTVVNGDGKVVQKIVKEYDPVKITGAMKDLLFKSSVGDRGLPDGYTFDLPGNFPAVYYFLIDDRGRTFVCTYEHEKRDDGYWRSYDVFDPEGRYIVRFALPEREMIFVSKKDKLYSLVGESEEGIPQVKRYAMTWK